MDEKNFTAGLCDPDMIFTVSNDPCRVLSVSVIEGHKISKGSFGDFLDTPDPYVILRVIGSPNGRKKTKYYDNNSSPKWQETFTFVLDPIKKYELEVILMDANYTIDQKLGSGIIDLGILVLNEEHDHVLKIGEKTDIMLRLLLTIDCNPDLRYSLSLSEMEKEFINCRRKRVMKKLCEFLGESAPMKEQEVPIVGVIGSGGGFRAMIAFSGVLKALTEEGILDCVTYIATLSGSAWYLSTLYSHPEFPKKSPGALQNELKSSICHSPFWLLSPRSLYRYITSIKAKYESGQPVSFTDFFGYLLGDTLLKGRIDCKLSDQKSKINDGNAPLPLYTCLHVKNNVSAKVFQDWLEFSPYEIGISKYAVFMKTHLFGSKLFKGKVVKVYPEYPLHYLQGVWGSAFCILFKRLIGGHTKLSIDVNPCSDSSGEDEDEIFYDAEEELHENEEDQLRSFLGNLDLDNDKTMGDNSDSENDEGNTKESSTKGFKRMLTSGFWKDFVNNICTSSFVDTRKGRAGVILNPLRGLSLIPCFQFSPFSPTSPGDDIPFKGLTEPTPTQSKTMYLVDGGLTFNLPFPLLLRPQRAVDVYLAFDFSSRDSDSIPPFKELLISEKWAKINNCPFPPIHDLVSEYVKQSPKECYVFKHPTDELCPVIVCFPLVNLDFKKYCKPGIRRETAEDLEFGDFSIFNDSKNCYSIYNFRYPHRQFERLSKLMEFNVLNNIGIIKEVFESVSERKKRHLSQASVVLADPPQKKI